MEYNEILTRVNQTLEKMDSSELKNLHADLVDRGYISDVGDEELNAEDLQEDIKNSLKKISAEELNEIAPPQIKQILSQLEAEVPEEISENKEQKIDVSEEETKETLIAEAVEIIAQRPRENAEIPVDLQPRLKYIISKLHIKFQISHREISRLINLNRATVANYEEKYVSEQPDLIKMWSQSVENKVFAKTEETISKQASLRAITTLRENITISDNVREKFAAAAAVRGYNLYDVKDFEKLLNKSIHLFFEIDGIFQSIMDVERENQKLRDIVHILKKQINQLNTLLYERNFTGE